MSRAIDPAFARELSEALVDARAIVVRADLGEIDDASAAALTLAFVAALLLDASESDVAAEDLVEIVRRRRENMRKAVERADAARRYS